MVDRRMKVGLWFYGLGTILTGILNIAWGAFDASHQPIQSLGKNLPGQQIMAYVSGVWLVTAGLAVLWRRTARIGAAASASVYLIFAAFGLLGYSAGIHTYGLRIAVLLGISFGVAQQVFLAAPAAIVFASTDSPDLLLQGRAATAARWMLGLPPIFFGLLHLAAIQAFAKIVPQWMPFGYFWAGLTGIAFFLAGCAICSGIKDVLAARLLALMLLLFECLVEVPPIVTRPHSQPTWGAAVYNLTAIGACLIFAEYLASRANRARSGATGNVAASRSDAVVA
ncbi:hypothetical protein ACPOL_0336 [Acidisarcina polymorpha]|uniref:Uncharacterized protein n=1 Tax=Acidisarcina polymorpha TaxID=2211140 RepID=A0A2Z5FT98_9BACT|nr:hypothetical protein [Acidisarcina polymorpha]AXC09717.1 hypothetical protein ACPOL_0336 [Acidisarcina polymorpha]